MRKIIIGKKFKKDSKKHYLEFVSNSWIEAVNCLCNDVPLPQKYCDHALQGESDGVRDCHIKPDLILLYVKTGTDFLELLRIGTHSELFD